MKLICLTIQLALAASLTDVQDAINSINDQFGTNFKNSEDQAELSAPQAAAIVGAPAAITTGTANAPQLDSAGLPWDDRIHSSSKALNTDGTWRGKRGVTPQMKGKVEAQLRNTLAASAPAAAAVTQAAVALPAMPAPPAAGIPPLPGANPAFSQFVQFVTANMAPNGRITDDWLKISLSNYGVADGLIQNLAHRPDLIPTIEAAFRQALAS